MTFLPLSLELSQAVYGALFDRFLAVVDSISVPSPKSKWLSKHPHRAGSVLEVPGLRPWTLTLVFPLISVGSII